MVEKSGPAGQFSDEPKFYSKRRREFAVADRALEKPPQSREKDLASPNVDPAVKPEGGIDILNKGILPPDSHTIDKKV